jgi:uracil-DNA glycosylase
MSTTTPTQSPADAFKAFAFDGILMPALTTMHPDWTKALMDPNHSLWAPLTSALSSVFHITGGKLTGLAPRLNLIFHAFDYTSPADIKVIIIGQDPYNQPGVATGLSFQANNKTPPSLINVEKAAGGIIDFEGAAKQGVLFLNAALTTAEGTKTATGAAARITAAHQAAWAPFTSAVLNYIIQQRNDARLVLMLWGEFAKKLKSHLISTPPSLEIMEWSHPSPMANNSLPLHLKFERCDHFKRTPEIRWTLGERRRIESECPFFVDYITSARLSDDFSENEIATDPSERLKYFMWLRQTHSAHIQHVIAHTDGAASANGSADCRAGWAYTIKDATFKKELKIDYQPLFGPPTPTSNRAELTAILECLKALKPYQIVEIHSDSLYSINTINNTWKRNSNLDLLEEIDKYKPFITALIHIKGHAGNEFNERVDRLAVQAKSLGIVIERDNNGEEQG